MLKKLQSCLLNSGIQVGKWPNSRFNVFSVFDLIISHPHIQKKASGFTFIQVGANDGVNGGDPIREYIRNNYWNGVLIEPQPQVFERLRRNYEGMNNLYFENVGISNERGSMKLYVPQKDDTTASFVKGSIHSNESLTEIDVNCVRLDDIIEKYQLNEIDLLQIDTEGFEYNVIQSINFSKHLPNIIQFEHGHMSRKHISQTFQLLSSQDYVFYYGGKQHQDTIAIQSNFLKTMSISIA